MKLQKTTGLVGAGSVNQSFVARMPMLLEQLGPVKGSSLKVSRRMANGLRAGVGVDDYSALAFCGLIWICAPENLLDSLASELASAIPLAGKVVVLCDMLCDSLWPSPLRTAGARIATLNCLPESLERTFVAEGHPLALAELRKLLARNQRRLIEIRPATKPLYLAGVHLASHLLLPWIAGATDCLRAAGMARNEAVRAVEALGERTLRAYGKAGDKAWTRAAAEQLRRAVAEDLEALHQTDTRLAALFSDGGERMLRYFAKPAQKQRLKVMARGSG
ncbi:MAG: DUF2520 domain-containing protein [Acidobacteriota bacterium]|nr:DUF2520 domain-containing protein [Acidobacteriota bacterium]